MSEVKRLLVTPAEAGMRLDRWLRRRWPHLTQVQIVKLARSGQLRQDGGRVKADTRLLVGASIRVPPLPEGREEPKRETLTAGEAEFARALVLFEDAQVLALNKPAGLAVQGGTKTYRHIDRLLGVWGEGAFRPRLTHRLDRDTSGVLLLAKTPDAAAFLAGAFARRLARKTYWAVVEGIPEPPSGRIEFPLVKKGVDDRERMMLADPKDPAAKIAVTEFETLAKIPDRAAWLALYPLTGRTHQLRAHLLAIGHPILGDPKYNTASSISASGKLKLQLHARHLRTPHPAGGMIDIEAPIGSELRAGFQQFGLNNPDGF